MTTNPFYVLIPNLPLFTGPSSKPPVASAVSLAFYISGTSLPQTVYLDQALTSPAPNPLSVPVAYPVYLQPKPYRLVLTQGASTLPSSPPTVWVIDPFYSPTPAPAGLSTYPGNPNGHVAGTTANASGTTLSSLVYDTVHQWLWIAVTSGTAGTTVWQTIPSQIPNLEILSNLSGVLAPPAPNTLTAIMDSSFGSTEGSILYRDAATWNTLGPSTSGYILTTQGSGAPPLWEPPPTTGVTSVSGTAPIIATGSSSVTISFGTVPNNQSIFWNDSSSTPRATLVWNSSNIIELGDISNAHSGSSVAILGNSAIFFDINASLVGEFTSTGLNNCAIGQSTPEGASFTFLNCPIVDTITTTGWYDNTGVSTLSGAYFHGSATSASQREYFAGVQMSSNLGSGAASEVLGAKVALTSQIKGLSGSGDIFAFYPVTIISSGSLGSTGYVSQVMECDLNNSSGVDLSNGTTIGGKNASSSCMQLTGFSTNTNGTALLITGTGAGGGQYQWDKGIWFADNGHTFKTYSILDQGNATYSTVDSGTRFASYNMIGSYNYGIIMNSGTFSGAQIIGNGFNIDTAGNFNHTSDLSLKDNVTTRTGTLAKVIKLRPVDFTWNSKATWMNGKPDHGLIAQEVQVIYPEFVMEPPQSDKMTSTYLSIDLQGLIPELIGAVQELNTRLSILEKGSSS